MIHHDVDVTLTTKAPECKSNNMDVLLDCPIQGDLCPTFDGINSMAVIYGGGWADWEPYRCTYEFSSKHDAMKFSRHVLMEYPDSVNINFSEWDDD